MGKRKWPLIRSNMRVLKTTPLSGKVISVEPTKPRKRTKFTVEEGRSNAQFGRIPVLEESVTSHFFCSCENTQKAVKIIERNWCLMLKAPYQSLGAISGNFE